MTEILIAPANANISSVRAGAPAAGVFVSDQDSEGIIRQSLSTLGIENVQFTPGNVDTAVATFAKARSPQLLIVDVSGVDDPIASIRELAEVCEPDIYVVVIGDRNDIVLYRDLKKMGISEYFLKPVVRDLFTRACHGILTPQRDQPRLNTGKLIFILGARGGVGATTIATNIAWYLAETRRRHTMLLDLDMQGGDAALQLDAAPNNALREAFEHPERVDQLYLERGVKHVTERLDLLASLDTLSVPILPTEDAILALLEKPLVRYRFVIVDLPSSIAIRMTRLIHLPSTCLLVSNASLAAARDVARWREHLGPDSPERSTLHILNQTAAHGGLPDADFIKGCGGAPDIIIPYDREMAEASTYGIKAMQKCTVFKRGLMRLLQNLTGEPMDEQGSILSRIFG